MISSLETIANGSTVIVKHIKPSDLKVKLLEMGFCEGRELRVLYRAPLGDPIAIEIGGYVLSMRRDEAREIDVETLASDK